MTTTIDDVGDDVSVYYVLIIDDVIITVVSDVIIDAIFVIFLLFQ